MERMSGDLTSCLIKSSRLYNSFRNLKLGTLLKCKFSTQSSVFQWCLNSSIDVIKLSAQPNLSFVLLLFKSLLDTCGSYDAHCWSGLCGSSSPAHLELFKLRKNCVHVLLLFDAELREAIKTVFFRTQPIKCDSTQDEGRKK